MRLGRAWGLMLAAVLAGCSPRPQPVDLLSDAAREAWTHADVAGRDRAWVAGQTGKQVRINDVVRRTLPASPPSRLRFAVDIPQGRAPAASPAASPRAARTGPAIEFVVKVRQDGREETVWTQLLDPARAARAPQVGDRGRRPRRATPAAAASSSSRRAASRRTRTTRGARSGATPALTVPDDDAPLVIVYLVDTLRADHTHALRLRARHHAGAGRRSPRTRVVFEQAIAPGLVDQARRWRRSSPRCCPAATARCSCATRSTPAT